MRLRPGKQCQADLTWLTFHLQPALRSLGGSADHVLTGYMCTWQKCGMSDRHAGSLGLQVP